MTFLRYLLWRFRTLINPIIPQFRRCPETIKLPPGGGRRRWVWFDCENRFAFMKHSSFMRLIEDHSHENL